MASLVTSRNFANKTENRIQVYAEIKKSYDVNFSLFFFFDFNEKRCTFAA